MERDTSNFTELTLVVSPKDPYVKTWSPEGQGGTVEL